MTTDNFDAIVDDSCFNDIFTMQSQTLHDFEFGLEATDIGSLLELFEENQKRKYDSTCFASPKKRNVSVKLLHNEEIKTHPNVSPPKVVSVITSNKRKGISLLAKPKKVSNDSTKKTLIDSNATLTSFSYLDNDHSYCLRSLERDYDRLYNKIPDYITIKSVTREMYNDADVYDKIPNYIKGFLSSSILMGEIDITDENTLDYTKETESIEVTEVTAEDKVIEMINENNDFMSNSNELSHVNSNENEEISPNASDNTSNFDDDDDDDITINLINCKNSMKNNDEKYCNNNVINVRQSRSKSRELPKSYRRRRRISTRSSVASESQSSTSSRSSSCSSCSSCSSYYSDSEASDCSINDHSNSSDDNRKDTKSIELKSDTEKWKTKAKLKRQSQSQIKNIPYSDRNKSQTRNKMVQKPNNRQSNPRIGEGNRDSKDRKIVYAGKIPDGTTKSDLRHWFGMFGAIKEVSVHFRDFGDNYAFVTFYRSCDAFEAVDHANDDQRHPKFDLSFGGRRKFCKTKYEDLDFAEDDDEFNSGMDFDSLLRSTKAKLC